jgi:hypothetical protein
LKKEKNSPVHPLPGNRAPLVVGFGDIDVYTKFSELKGSRLGMEAWLQTSAMVCFFFFFFKNFFY